MFYKRAFFVLVILGKVVGVSFSSRRLQAAPATLITALSRILLRKHLDTNKANPPSNKYLPQTDRVVVDM